jgi:hypothetical protein
LELPQHPDEGVGSILAEFTRVARNSLQDAANSMRVSKNSLFGANKFPVALTPPELEAHLKLGAEVMEALRKGRTPVVPA